MTQAEAARELACSVATIRNMIDDGELIGIKLGNLPKSGVRVLRTSFDAFCKRAEEGYAKRLGKSA